MPKVSIAFFAFGVLCLAGGMIWGMIMGSSGDFALAAAHAHLNLLGWVTMALYGIFYALTRDTMSVRLAWANFLVSSLGVIVFIPAIAMLVHTGKPIYGAAVGIGSAIAFIGLLLFAVSVLRELFRKNT